MKNWILVIFTIFCILRSNLVFATFLKDCDYEPKYSGAEIYTYTIKFSAYTKQEAYPYGYEFWLNGERNPNGTSYNNISYDEVKKYYTTTVIYNIPASYHKIGQNIYWYESYNDRICVEYGPYIYDYITPTPTITQTLTPTSTPLPMTEKWVPYWEVNHGKMRDTFFTVSNSSEVYVEGAFEFYDNNVDTVGLVPLTLAPHGMQTLTADHVIFSQKSETEASPVGGYYGYGKVMVMGGDFEVFGAVYRANVGIEYTLSTMEPMASPVHIPLFQAAERLSDTLLYLTNPNDEKIDVSGKLYANNGEKIAYFNITLSPHKMKERALSIHIDPSIKSLYGSCILEWDTDAGIMVFPLVRYINTDSYFRVEVK